MATQEYGEFINNTQQGFTIVINKIINYELLSLKAKGLYLFIASKPSGWNFSIPGIASQNKENKAAIRSGLHELEEYGLLVRTSLKGSNGKFSGYRYTVTANLITKGLPPSSDFRTTENGTTENRTLSKKEQSKKEKENNQQEKKVIQKSVVVNSENLENQKLIYENFGIVGFGIERIKKFISEFGDARMNLVWLEYLDNQLKVKNPQGWIVSGLKNFDLKQQEEKIRIAAEAQQEDLFAIQAEIITNSQLEELKSQKELLMSQIKNWIKIHQTEFKICLQKALEKIQQIKPIYFSLISKAKNSGKELIEVIKENMAYSSWVYDEVKAVM